MMWIGALLLVSVSAISENEACQFVGSRFVRVASACEDGVCVDLSQMLDGRVCPFSAVYPPLPCAIAVIMVNSFLRDHRPGLRIPKRLRADQAEELVMKVRSHLIPSLEVVSAGGSPALVELAANLTLLHNWSLQTASADWDAWRDETVPALFREETYAEMTRLFAHLLDAMKRSSFLSWQRREALATLVHFYHDFAALIGVHTFGNSHVMSLGKAAAYSPRRYRSLDFRDFDHGDSITGGCPRCAVDLVKLSAAIDVLAGEFENPPLNETDTFIRLLAGWVLNRSSADALLLNQIRTGLCSSALTLVSAISERSWDPLTIERVGVSLIEICLGHTPLDELKDLRTFLAFNWFDDADGSEPPADGIARPRNGTAIATLKRDDLPWVLGLSGCMHQVKQQEVSSWMLEEFVDAHMVYGVNEDGSDYFVFAFDSDRDSVAQLGLAFGRALGLCLLHDGDLRVSNLPLAFVYILLPRNRLLLSSTAAVTAALGSTNPQVIEMSLSIIAGLEQTLGPGGPELFTDAEWMRRFGH